jgi:ABC-type phosphate/phosphonate transport system substrate-binding protein
VCQHDAQTAQQRSLWSDAVSDLDYLTRQEWLALALIQGLDALRDGLRPFVVRVLEEKEGPHWFTHPRVQRMLPAPPVLEGEAPYGIEVPALDLALLLKLIGSDCYWYRTFRPRLPGISRWQIDSLRELRNRLAHNDGADPLFTRSSLLLPYLDSMEQLLQVIGSDQVGVIGRLRAGMQRRRRQLFSDIALGRSRWSFPFWLGLATVMGGCLWFVDYLGSPQVDKRTIVIGTPDKRLERYLPLEQHLEARLRPSQFFRALRGEKIDVRISGARSYPEAVAYLRARQWDVLLGFSPVVSMEAVHAGYRPIGRMFPHEPEYRAILFTRQESTLRSLKDITAATRLALGDFFSATKYYVPMSMLRGRSARITLNLSTAEIAEQVRSGSADVGAMAGHPLRFTRLNPGMRILASSPLLPQSIVALSPNLSDLDRDRLQRALLNAPDSVRGQSAADFGPGATPDYRLFARQVAEGKVFSACLRNQAPELKLHCPASDRINLVEGWISHVQADGDRVLILLQTADHYSFSLVIDRALLEQIAMFQVLNDLRGRFVRVLSLRPPLESQSLMIKTPHQLDIRP